MSELTPEDVRDRKAALRSVLIAVGIAVGGILLILLCGSVADLAGISVPDEQEPPAASETASQG